MIRRNFFLPLATVLSIAGFCSVAVADIHYFVQMKVNSQETKLDIKTNKGDAGGCSGSSKKGCIRANQGDQIKASFLLAGNTKCKEAAGSYWKLGDVFLGGKNSSGKPTTWGGFDNDQQVKDDFYFSNAAEGKLNSTKVNDRQITIEDKNSSIYEIWYKVTADCVDTAGLVLKTISVDPRVKNEGK